MLTALRIALLIAMLGLWVIGILFLIHVREFQAAVRTLLANGSPQAPVRPDHGYGYPMEGQIQREDPYPGKRIPVSSAALRRAVADERPVETNTGGEAPAIGTWTPSPPLPVDTFPMTKEHFFSLPWGKRARYED